MKLVLGTAQFGLNYGINNKIGKIPDEESFKILNYALGKIDLIDTAPAYGDSEELIGKFIQQKNCRDNFNIITKFSLNGDNVADSVSSSLSKLNVKKLYACLIHNFNFFKENRKIWTTLNQFKKQGKIQKIGFSLYHLNELQFLLDNKINFDIIQVPFSVFDQRFINFFSLLKFRGIEIHVRSVFLQGLVFKKIGELNNHFLPLKKKLLKLQLVSSKVGVSISSLCLNFAVLNKFIDKVVIGVDNLGDLMGNIKVLGQKEKVAKVYEKLVKLREDNENLILPINWKK